MCDVYSPTVNMKHKCRGEDLGRILGDFNKTIALSIRTGPTDGRDH